MGLGPRRAAGCQQGHSTLVFAADAANNCATVRSGQVRLQLAHEGAPRAGCCTSRDTLRAAGVETRKKGTLSKGNSTRAKAQSKIGPLSPTRAHNFHHPAAKHLWARQLRASSKTLISRVGLASVLAIFSCVSGSHVRFRTPVLDCRANDGERREKAGQLSPRRKPS